MEQFFKEKLNTCVNYFKNKMIENDNCKLIETKRKIYYFSKFSLEMNEFINIFKMIKSIKENLFKNLLETIKYCARGKINIIG
jgi:cystathionine beta-lyase family protein involved in aluminum resistance